MQEVHGWGLGRIVFGEGDSQSEFLSRVDSPFRPADCNNPHPDLVKRKCSCGCVDCLHEHDGYDPSYIMEFRMLVRDSCIRWDSCIRCKGIVWLDVSRHDLP